LAQELATPATSQLFAEVLETPAVQELARRLEEERVLSFTGVVAAAQPFLAVLLQEISPNRPVVVVTEGLKIQESFHQDLTTWLEFARAAEATQGAQAPPPSGGGGSGGLESAFPRPWFYPSWETLPHEDRLPHVDVISDRLATLVALRHFESGRRGPLVVTSAVALLQATFTPETLASRTRGLAPGARSDPLDLVEWLEEQGYEPEAQVTQKGEIALRGGILDVYPPTSPWPVRLEFFGDELESLRYFDPLTQISREQIGTVTLPPAGELGLLRSRLKAGGGEAPGTLLDYLPPETIWVLCEPEQLTLRMTEYEQQVPGNDPLLVSWAAFQQAGRARGMTFLSVAETTINEGLGAGEEPVVFPAFQGLDAYRPLAERAPDPQIAEAQRREFFAQIHRWLRQSYQVHVFCNNDGERQRFGEIWMDYGFGEPGRSSEPASFGVALKRSVPLTARDQNSTDQVLDAGLSTHAGTLARGFLCDTAKVVVVTDAEIFGRYRVQRPRRLKGAHAQATRSALDIDFTDLAEGDYVVHLQHGIGRYVGLKVLPTGLGTKPVEGPGAQANAGQECLVIEYAPREPAQPPPRLHVPVTEAHLVSKYVGAGKAHPPLNTLGGVRWAKAKEQAERAVRDVAGDLLAIQAARQLQAGHAFAPDTPWQREFEGSFIFEETPDQSRAIVETKLDMERPKPMDRLICGDVGFGKTEVGIRAAFKAVMDGRQVAVLVPTTVLAQQHFNTFRERMADYPIRVELLSRFRSRGAQERVVKDLAAGAVDIVIGTHRLLQADIGFKDLGLVIIDEEQRFGVMHKEKFKMLRKLVDVLTLSATPIPRTLYLALSGARDMSTIQTPPHDRLPVETIVTAYDERLIRDAIQRELNRGGQVFFLHNRVLTIESMAQKLRTLLPSARLVVGHGQMHSDELEEVMTLFVNGEADVLLSTTIIESGLDIPNANTIIIDRADRFGLSDLYQLRGRVGRYKHQAYAYLLLPRHAGLLADARKRLSAIKQYSTLGSGFKIAMRDLEIRGAGNLLGAEQSGHITAVGFDLYCQLLKQSVARLKGEPVKPRVEIEVRLDFLALHSADERSEPRSKSLSQTSSNPLSNQTPKQPAKAADIAPATAYIPFNYISDARQRIEIYRKLAQANEKDALASLEQESRDRFGPLPPPLTRLLQVAELKILASGRGITTIEVKDDKLMLTRNHDFVMIGSKFPRLTKPTPAARLKEIKKFILAL